MGIGLSINGCLHTENQFDDRAQDWLVQRSWLRRLHRLDCWRHSGTPFFSPPQSRRRKETLFAKWARNDKKMNQSLNWFEILVQYWSRKCRPFSWKKSYTERSCLVSAVMAKHSLEKLLLFVRFMTWLKPRIEWPLFAHKELNREKYHRKSC